jgi:uncharacterized protein (TIGR02246 family)
MGLENMVATKQIKLAALAMSLGIALSSATTQMAQARSSKKAAAASTSTAKGGTQSDDAAVRAQLSQFSKFLAAGDAHSLANLWTEDGEYVDEDGHQSKGRKALEERFTMVANRESKPNITLLSDSIKFLAPSVAMVEGTVEREHDGQSRPTTHFDMVWVKGDGGWLLSNASERELVATSNYEFLRHFNWIIGDWSAQSSAATVNMKAEWVPSKNFILCKYDTSKKDGGHSVDMQIIGWDPILGMPRSWHFDSSGGYGQGFWSKANNQWVCDATAVESDASTTKARNIITVTGPDSFTWTSVNRSVDGMAVGDAPSLMVQRVGK